MSNAPHESPTPTQSAATAHSEQPHLQLPFPQTNMEMIERKSVTNKDPDEKNLKRPPLDFVHGTYHAGLNTGCLSLLILGLIAMLSACLVKSFFFSLNFSYYYFKLN